MKVCVVSSCGVPLLENGVTRFYFRKVTEFYKVAPTFAWWVFKQVRSYDLANIHVLFSFTSVAAVWAARWTNTPYLISPHGMINAYGTTQRRPLLKKLSLRFIEGPMLRHAAAVHFTSEIEHDEALQLGISLRSVVFPLGIEPMPLVDAALVRTQYPALGADPYLLFLSRLDSKKNVEGLLQAFALAQKSCANLRLVIAGDGASDYGQKLKAMVGQLGLDAHVVWAGHIEGDLNASALAGAHLFILPSFSENFGIAAAEALMAGLPCVLGQGVAIATDVVEAGAGVAVLPDPESIAAGLMQVMNAPEQRATMAANAIGLARSKYSAEATGEKLVQLYSQISTGMVPVQKS